MRRYPAGTGKPLLEESERRCLVARGHERIPLARIDREETQTGIRSIWAHCYASQMQRVAPSLPQDCQVDAGERQNRCSRNDAFRQGRNPLNQLIPQIQVVHSGTERRVEAERNRWHDGRKSLLPPTCADLAEYRHSLRVPGTVLRSPGNSRYRFSGKRRRQARVSTFGIDGRQAPTRKHSVRFPASSLPDRFSRV